MKLFLNNRDDLNNVETILISHTCRDWKKNVYCKDSGCDFIPMRFILYFLPNWDELSLLCPKTEIRFYHSGTTTRLVCSCSICDYDIMCFISMFSHNEYVVNKTFCATSALAGLLNSVCMDANIFYFSIISVRDQV